MKYLNKAEELKTRIKEGPKKQVIKQGHSGKGDDKKEDGKGDEDDELKKALDGVIVKEKPNIKWDDVAGLEMAKRAL